MKTAVVICPGRGTYNAGELGYLARYFPRPDLLQAFDATLEAQGHESLSALDGAARYSMAKHGKGQAASSLIYAASYGDFLAINRGEIEIVAVTGNSMGWYTALACAGALGPQEGFQVASTMGALMQEAMIGGQVVYPWMDENWVPDITHKTALLDIVSEINARKDHTLAPSIELGGMLVLAGNALGLSAFETTVPRIDGRFPMRLANHAGFHHAMQAPVAQRGRAALPAELFRGPDLPMIDGRGAIWWPGATNRAALWDYTLGHQVVEPYDFTRAITVAAREFAPDLFIITGPGTTLGGAVAQSLILANWQDLTGKPAFKSRQEEKPILLSMGLSGQRVHVT